MVTTLDGLGFVLHERAETFTTTGTGWLSLKSFRNGHALYQTSEGTYRSSEDAFLILNHGERYTISIDALQPIESLCIFFAPTLVSQVHTQLAKHEAALLDNPFAFSKDDLPLLQRTYQVDWLFQQQLEGIRGLMEYGAEPLHPKLVEGAELGEAVITLLHSTLSLQAHIQQERAQLPAIRAATRSELYRRLYLVKEYLHASYDQPINLGQLSRIAGLSTNHLLRTFRQLFGQSPYQYLTSLRLQQACTRLRQNKDSITDICLAIGYSSLGTFSHKFRQRFGISPQAYRQRNR